MLTQKCLNAFCKDKESASAWRRGINRQTNVNKPDVVDLLPCCLIKNYFLYYLFSFDIIVFFGMFDQEFMQVGPKKGENNR